MIKTEIKKKIKNINIYIFKLINMSKAHNKMTKISIILK